MTKKNIWIRILQFLAVFALSYFVFQVFIHPLLHLDISYVLYAKWMEGLLSVCFAALVAVILYAREVKSSESSLRRVLLNLPDVVIIKDAKNRWAVANQFALDLFQLNGKTYRGKTDGQLGEEVPFFREALQYCETSDAEAWLTRQPVYVEETVPLPDGMTRIFETIKVPLFYSNGKRFGLIVIGRDVTQRKRVEETLRAREETYRLITENSSDMISMINRDGKVIYASPSHRQIEGFNPKKYEGKSAFQFVHPDDLCLVESQFQNTIRTRKPTRVEFRYKNKARDGWSVMEVHGMPVVGEDGQVESIVAVSRDVTERKRTEELLRKSDKLSVVGQLAAGVAHEIRNPLTSIKGFIQLLQKEDENHPAYYQIILSELERIEFIIREFLMLAKPQLTKFEQQDIGAIVKSVCALLETQAIMNNIQIVTDIEPGLPAIECEDHQLKQVFVNVLKNAIEAMPNGGTVEVSVKRIMDDRILICVRDEGQGIPEERLRHLGEPFYTTKEKGTGLGLMVSYKIIESHQGEIHIKSQVGSGTTVEIDLPIRQHRELIFT
jgi:two-component system, sporulation sensor kinase E